MTLDPVTKIADTAQEVVQQVKDEVPESHLSDDREDRIMGKLDQLGERINGLEKKPETPPVADNSNVLGLVETLADKVGQLADKVSNIGAQPQEAPEVEDETTSLLQEAVGSVEETAGAVADEAPKRMHRLFSRVGG